MVTCSEFSQNVFILLLYFRRKSLLSRRGIVVFRKENVITHLVGILADRETRTVVLDIY